MKLLNAAIGTALILYGNTLACVGALMDPSFVYANVAAFIVIDGVFALVIGIVVLLSGAEVAPKRDETVKLEQ